jgi:hypothetical protein
VLAPVGVVIAARKRRGGLPFVMIVLFFLAVFLTEVPATIRRVADLTGERDLSGYPSTRNEAFRMCLGEGKAPLRARP